ncbi:motile sperm domain-containing protein 2 [Sinocyclocheilus anshuiensis]|uniref:motile sperm domain-containing protein 2 n=1 Tax=Sinocyclocheilus anshuiensis TaxID=1608454 RepID=UPI0007B9A096|nr:PREDICTED: motile sperm domain-containing protein 2 [Sinocyclocheilus anshuiensis]
MAEAGQAESEQDIESKIEETRQRFKSECVGESQDKYDSRDVERLFKDDALVEGYLTWRHFVVEDTLKMIDESLQWRKEFTLNDLTESSIPGWMFESGAVFLHGYDKEGNKLFWFRVKLHVKDAKMILDKKRYVAFWLERYAKREPGMPLTVVFDMSESGISNIMPWIMNAAWKIVKTWLGPEAISKLKFVTKSDIQTYVGPEHLPPHMGGTDQFKYSYPPLPDDDFQSPICENGPIVSEDESDIKDIESESKETLESSFNSEQSIKPKKVNFLEDGQKSEDLDRGDPGRLRGARKPTTTFMGTLLHISPSEELRFGAKESEKKCLIILNNVTKNHVAFKVRTTAPEKYRVKPSNSSCEHGASVDIVVSLHGGFQASPQDRFLVMAAEMESSGGAGVSELAQFWKEVSKAKVMEHRLRCLLLESPKSILSNWSESPSAASNEHQDLQSTLMRVMASNSRLEQKLDSCLWTQKVLVLMVWFLLALAAYSLWTS